MFVTGSFYFLFHSCTYFSYLTLFSDQVTALGESIYKVLEAQKDGGSGCSKEHLDFE